MTAKIERIGDRFGLLLPKELIEACGFGPEVSVTLRDKTLVVAGADHSGRTGWEKAIRDIPQELIDRDFEELQAFRELPSEWDTQGWQWPEAGPDEKA